MSHVELPQDDLSRTKKLDVAPLNSEKLGVGRSFLSQPVPCRVFSIRFELTPHPNETPLSDKYRQTFTGLPAA